MAVSSIFKGSTIQVTGPNKTSDWQLSDVSSTIAALEPGIPIRFIMVSSGASRDKVVVKDRNDSGPEIARFECASSYDQKIVYFDGARHKPYIDVSAGAGGKQTACVLTIEVE